MSFYIIIVCLTIAVPQIKSQTYPLPSNGLARIVSLINDLKALHYRLEERYETYISNTVEDFRGIVYDLPSVDELQERVDEILFEISLGNREYYNNISDCSNLLGEIIDSFSEFSVGYIFENGQSDFQALQDDIAYTLHVAEYMNAKISFHTRLCDQKKSNCTTTFDYETKLKNLAKDVKLLWTDYRSLGEIQLTTPASDELINRVNLSIIKPVEKCVKSKRVRSSNEESNDANNDEEVDPACIRD